MSNPWKSFFGNYRNKTVQTNADLFTQVGRTINGKPISEEEFQRGVRHVATALALTPSDVLFEFCCGNGLVCYELAGMVRHVIGVDFTEHLIEAAGTHRQRANIQYHLGDALQPITPFARTARPNKYLMGFALGHFDPGGLRTVLEHILEISQHGTFLFFVTGIPDAANKWSFYNSPERRERALENERAGSVINDGIGRWWTADEIISVTRELGLSAEVRPEPPGLTNYRMDALIK